MFIIKHMENIIIIGTYPNEPYKEELLKECIDRVKPLGFDILLVSHYPIPTSIQDMVDYVFYDKQNNLVSSRLTPKFGLRTEDFVLERSGNGHILTVSTNIVNGVKVANSLNYSNFIYMEYDNIFGFDDLFKLGSLLKSTLTLGKKMFFFNHVVEDISIYETLIFGGVVKYFIGNVSLPVTEDDLKNESISLERWLYAQQRNFQDNLYLIPNSSKGYFSQSEINKEFNKYIIQVLPSNRESRYYLFAYNFYSQKIQLNFLGTDFVKELHPNCWYLQEVFEETEYNVEVECDGRIKTHTFFFNFEDKIKLMDKGFITYK